MHQNGGCAYPKAPLKWTQTNGYVQEARGRSGGGGGDGGGGVGEGGGI